MDAITVGVMIAVAVVALLVGIFVDRFLLDRLGRNRLAQAREDARRLLAEAEQEVERLRFERIEKVETELVRREELLTRDTAEAKRTLRRSKEKLVQRQQKLARRAQRLQEREQVLDLALEAVEALRSQVTLAQRDVQTLGQHAAALEASAVRSEAEVSIKMEQLQQQHTTLEAHAEAIDAEAARLEADKAELVQARAEVLEAQEAWMRKLEQVSGMTRRVARREMLDEIVSEARLEAASYVKDIRDEARLKANREGRRIILAAIQRTAASHAIENTVSVVNIQSDEMKGRIIGREGRNIRAFEAATGIEVIVDDTPEAVILSGFNPVRREIARLSMVRLIQDGRIHPARIEEVVSKVREEVEEEIIETGERTVIDLNLHGLHPELVRHVGRMRYRTSYGQNLLSHSIETARIASLMAAELALDTTMARRAGLLHDIGKVVEDDLDSPHAIVGMELCRKYREHEEICNAVGAHHDEIEMTCLIAPIVQSADAISGARPGARREALESYIKRLEKLEALAAGFEGVERVFAIQAGREIRVLVNHDLVSDALAEQLAIDISKKIQSDMQYPGQIKVTVIREVRSVSYAK